MYTATHTRLMTLGATGSVAAATSAPAVSLLLIALAVALFGTGYLWLTRHKRRAVQR